MRMLSVLVLALLLPSMGNAQKAGSENPAGADKGEVAPATGFLPTSRPGFASTPEAGSFAELCPTIRMQNRGEFEFTPMETRLLCGDPTQDAIGVPWATIPPNQAAYFLKGFLQSRAYHLPEFIQDGNVLFVRPGNESRLSKFSILGGPLTWDPPRRRLVEGEPLTPGLLDDLQSWTLSQLKDEGYACATAASRADPRTGEAIVELKPGELKYIKGVEDTGDTGLRKGVLDRYNAFKVGQLYRERKIALTRRRTQEDGFLQTLVLTARCEPDGVTIVRDVNLGPSRTVRVGVGASTDLGARFRVILTQNRIGASASSAEARLNLSYKETKINRQSVDTRYKWYYSADDGRSFLEPALLYVHAAEQDRDYEIIEPRVMHGWGKEFNDGQLEVRLGPSLQAQRLFRGVGAGTTSTALLETTMEWMSHDFEYFDTSPRKGEVVTATALATQEGWGSNVTAQKIELQGEKLWNIYRYDPPLLVLGARYNLSSTFTSDPNALLNLPIRFLNFLGGERDLRGFDYRSLPRSGIGALSAASVGFEARFHRVIMKRADVFGFLDSGLVGDSAFALRKPFLMSPGAGVRWESPIGVLRAYVAMRFAVDEPPEDASYGRGYRLGFTFGEEF